MLRLYTQNNCPYCDVLKKKLESWGVGFTVLNISENPYAKEFLRENGHKTVPQLYLENFNVNAGFDTEQFTEENFYDRLDEFILEKGRADIRTIVSSRVKEINEILESTKSDTYKSLLVKDDGWTSALHLYERYYPTFDRPDYEIKLKCLNTFEIDHCRNLGIPVR